MNKNTSLKLSKQLTEWGCKLESEFVYNKYWEIAKRRDDLKPAWELYPAYDILNEICVKYAKEFFGGRDDSHHKLVMHIWDCKYHDTNWTMKQYYSISIMMQLQEWEYQEAEDYIRKNTLFNPNNK